MSENTKIEWATHTFNPWIGCTKVSPGCKNCYAAELDANRFSRTMDGGTKEKPVSHWGKGAPRHRTKGWNVPLRWDAECGVHPGYRARVFPSLMDWLDDEVPIEWLADFLELIHDTPNLDWLLLSKRPELFEERLLEAYMKFEGLCAKWADQWRTGEAIPANVWLGVSVEDQKRADERIPLLTKIPAKIRFLSVEPLLEAVNLHQFLCQHASPAHPEQKLASICSTPTDSRWVIVGGESGPGCRDCGAEAIANAVRQCVDAGVPVFCKQDCAAKPGQKGRLGDDVWARKEFPKL